MPRQSDEKPRLAIFPGLFTVLDVLMSKSKAPVAVSSQRLFCVHASLRMGQQQMSSDERPVNRQLGS